MDKKINPKYQKIKNSKKGKTEKIQEEEVQIEIIE